MTESAKDINQEIKTALESIVEEVRSLYPDIRAELNPLNNYI